MSDAAAPDGYEMGVMFTMTLIGSLRHLDGIRQPRFRFPKDVALLVSLDKHGGTLCVNEPAWIILGGLLQGASLLNLPSPTAMMLQVALEHHGIPYDEVELSELDLPGAKFIVKGGAKA